MARTKEKILKDLERVEAAIAEDIENLKERVHEKTELEQELREVD